MQDALSDFKSWYFSKPLVTRSYLALSFILSAVVSLGFISPYSLTYTFQQTIFQFNLWRPITASAFMGKFSFNLIFQMYFAYMFLSKTQTQLFSKQTYADFLWLVSSILLSLVVISSIFQFYTYANAFLMAITYIYCKRRPFEQFRLMFGFKVKSGYFPFVWAALRVLLMGESLLPNIIGLGLGHLYIVCKDIFVVKYHKDYLATPQFLKKWWYGASAPQRTNLNQPNRGNSFFAGTGVRIG